MKKILTIITFVMTFAAAIFGSPDVVNATSSTTTPKVVANDYTANQNGYAYININAENFVDVGSIELFIYYDSTLFEITSNYTLDFLSSSSCVTNTETQGEASLHAISLDGLSGNGSMWRITFRVKGTTPAGKHPITVAVGEVYSKSLEPLMIESQNFYINVSESPEVINTIPIYSSNNNLKVSQNDIFEIKYYTYNGYDFASADFEIEYDNNIFELVSVNLGSSLTNSNGAVYSINDEVAGYINISYASLTGISYANPLITIKLKVVSNVNESSEINFSANSIYDSNLNLLNCDNKTNIINVLYQEPAVDLPNIKVEDYSGCLNEFEINVVVDGSTKLAAADFVITYDQTVLKCLNIAKNQENSMVVVNPKYDDGLIKFSFICEEGVSTSSSIVKIRFEPLLIKKTNISITGYNLVDCEFNNIDVEFVSSEISLKHELVSYNGKAATCESNGWYKYEQCLNCDYTTYKEIAALGHNKSIIPAKEATCEEIGWASYETCSRCDYSTYEEVPALGHEKELIEAKEPTCTEDGWNSYETCTRCDYTTYVEIERLGHLLTSFEGLPATCEANGYEKYDVCSRCDYTTYKEIAALGHNKVTVSAKEATCEEIGWASYETCSRCDYSTYEVIPALGHLITILPAQDPTCIENGWESYEGCTRCGYGDKKLIESLGHDLITIEELPATCEENGHKKYDVCSRCDYTTYEEIVALGHNYYIIEQELPTCTKNGYSKYVCYNNDNHSYIDELYATGHKLSYYNGKPATCINDGYESYEQCSNCNYTTYKKIAKLGHNYVSELIEPTCESDGYTKYVCLRCYDTYKNNYASALGHKYHEIHVDPTASTDGYDGSLCDACGKINKTIVYPSYNSEYVSFVSVLSTIRNAEELYRMLKTGQDLYTKVDPNNAAVREAHEKYINIYNNFNGTIEKLNTDNVEAINTSANLITNIFKITNILALSIYLLKKIVFRG